MELFTRLEQLGLQLDKDILRNALQSVTETLMNLDVSTLLDADYYERSDTRAAYRNGYRKRVWKTQIGTVSLRIPKLRRGTYAPQFVDPGFDTDIIRLVQRAFVQELTQIEVHNFLAERELPHVNAAILYEQLDSIGTKLRHLPIDPIYPFLWLDVIPVSEQSPKIAAVAVGLRKNGDHALLGFKTGYSRDDEDFWLEFIRSLTNRGLNDVQLVISDSYRGIKAAIYEELIGAEWQYSQMHFLRTLLEHVAEDDKLTITDAIASILVQPDRRLAIKQLQNVSRSFKGRFPQAMAILHTCQNDLLAYTLLSQSQQFELNLALSSIKQNLIELPDAIGIPLTIASTQIEDSQHFYPTVFQPIAVL